MNFIAAKFFTLSFLGIAGSFVLTAFGGWTEAMTALMIFMLIDIITGLTVAAFFKNSEKTLTGSLSSITMSKGLCRKGAMLLIVLGAAQLDILLDLKYVREAVIIAFCANEFLSILENCGQMGIKFPPIITKAVEMLQIKSDETGDTTHD